MTLHKLPINFLAPRSVTITFLLSCGILKLFNVKHTKCNFSSFWRYITRFFFCFIIFVLVLLQLLFWLSSWLSMVLLSIFSFDATTGVLLSPTLSFLLSFGSSLTNDAAVVSLLSLILLLLLLLLLLLFLLLLLVLMVLSCKRHCVNGPRTSYLPLATIGSRFALCPTSHNSYNFFAAAIATTLSTIALCCDAVEEGVNSDNDDDDAEVFVGGGDTVAAVTTNISLVNLGISRNVGGLSFFLLASRCCCRSILSILSSPKP